MKRREFLAAFGTAIAASSGTLAGVGWVERRETHHFGERVSGFRSAQPTLRLLHACTGRGAA